MKVHYGCQITANTKIFEIYFTQTNKQPNKKFGRTNPECVVRAVLILTTKQGTYLLDREGKTYLYSTGRFQRQKIITNLLKKAGCQNVSTLRFLIMFYLQNLPMKLKHFNFVSSLAKRHVSWFLSVFFQDLFMPCSSTDTFQFQEALLFSSFSAETVFFEAIGCCFNLLNCKYNDLL